MTMLLGLASSNSLLHRSQNVNTFPSADIVLNIYI